MDPRIPAMGNLAALGFSVPMNALRAISLLAATMTMGLVSGAFLLYAHTIMPGLKKTDDRTFVTAFRSIDRAIINPWFMAGGFLGALVFTLAAVFAHRVLLSADAQLRGVTAAEVLDDAVRSVPVPLPDGNRVTAGA